MPSTTHSKNSLKPTSILPTSKRHQGSMISKFDRSRHQTRNQVTLPQNVPLPPSPPATDALEIDDDGQTESIPTRRRDSKPQIEVQIPMTRTTRSSKKSDQKRDFDSRSQLSDHHTHPSPTPSPINSPTQDRVSKRARICEIERSIDDLDHHRSSDPDPFNLSRDSPRNPFLAKDGEPTRRSGRFTDEKSRKLVYVFRGKRIQYDPGEDLHNTGDSPFTLSGPKLLFPSSTLPTSPTARLELKPGTKKQRMIEFETPKRKRVDSEMIPTPQSRPRRHHHQHLERPIVPLLDGPSGSRAGRPLSKPMR